jgi:hypothetical protein
MYDPTKPDAVAGQMQTMNVPGVPAAAQPIQQTATAPAPAAPAAPAAPVTTAPTMTPAQAADPAGVGEYHDEWNRLRENDNPRHRGRERNPQNARQQRMAQRHAARQARQDARATGAPPAPAMQRFVPGQAEAPEAMAMRIRRIRERRLATATPTR